MLFFKNPLTVSVGRLSARENNLSAWESLCCSEGASFRSVRVLNWLEWTQEIILSVREGLMLP